MGKAATGVVLLIFLSFGYPQAAGTGNDFISGEKSSHTVVLPEHPSACEETAANELVDHLKRMTGCRLPIVNEGSFKEGSGSCVCIGHTQRCGAAVPPAALSKLGPDGYVIQPEGRDLFLVGATPRGTLYAVYEFLERLGVRWLSKDCTVLPSLAQIELPKKRVEFAPPFRYRDQIWNCNPDHKWNARQRLNGEFARIPEEWGGSVQVGERCHSYHRFLPLDKMEANPDWVAVKEDGTRDRSVPHCVKPCTTHPGVREWVTLGVRNRLGRNPGLKQIWVSQDDGPSVCHCERCLAERRAHGGPDCNAANTLALANHVARNIRKDFPDVQIKTLAYAQTLEPPEKMRGEENVVVVLCGPHCTLHPMDECERNEAYVTRLKGWTAIANVQTYFYGANNYAFLAPYPSWFAMCSDYPNALRFGVKAVYRQGAGVGYGSDFAELRSYLTARMAWDPTRDAFKEAREFVMGYYGPGGQPILDYLLWYRERMKDNHGDETVEGWRAYVDEAVVRKGEQCFEKALEASKASPEHYRRVRASYLPTLYARVMREALPYPMFDMGEYRLMPGELTERSRNAASLFLEIMDEAGYTHWDENTIYEREANPIKALAKKQRYVTLKNGTDQVFVAPTLGGRPVRWDVGMLGGKSVFQRPDVKTIGYPYSGGYEEYSVYRRNSEGIAVEFEAAEVEEGRRVIMKGHLRNGIELTRTIELAAEAPTLRIKSEYANPTQAAQKLRLRNHPLFEFEVFRGARLCYEDADRAWHSESMYTEESRQDQKSILASELGAPLVAMADEKRGYALVNRYAEKDVERVYVFWGEGLKCVTLELWQRELEVPPGAVQTLEHSYEFVPFDRLKDCWKRR